jgi:hypothetical protein
MLLYGLAADIYNHIVILARMSSFGIWEYVKIRLLYVLYA